MKYVVILGDGMADYPVEELNGRTPLQVAKKPNIDALTKKSEVGIVYTTPKGMKPGSDNTNLGIMGYDPALYYTGRSPLEAASIGIDLQPDDITFRANLVTLSGETNYEDKTMVDYSSDEISTSEAAELIASLSKVLNNEHFSLYSGISYRHCLVWHHGQKGMDLTPPHDITTKPIQEHLPKGDGSAILYSMMKESYDLLKEHPVNLKRIRRGLHPANSLWFWGEGSKPQLTSMEEKYGKKGAVISAVDLIKGIGILAGMESIDVEGATGTYNTNYEGKTEAALNALKNGKDFVYIHMEGPDECGHRHEVENKITAIERIDEKVVGPMIKGLDEMGEDYAVLILPDHATPLSVRTHVNDPVPYLLYRKGIDFDSGVSQYDEDSARSTGIVVTAAHTLLNKMFQ